MLTVGHGGRRVAQLVKEGVCQGLQSLQPRRGAVLQQLGHLPDPKWRTHQPVLAGIMPSSPSFSFAQMVGGMFRINLAATSSDVKLLR